MKTLLISLLVLISTSFTQPRPGESGVQQTGFSLENATAIHRILAVDIGARPMGSPAEQRALRFAADRFREYGCDSSYVMPMTQTGRANTTSGVAVGIKRGATGRIIVIGGHIDSSGPEVPGADDNASGSAVVIELAHVFCQRPMQSTLVFTCFGGEEQGLEGSRFFTNNFLEIDSAVLMLNVDMANGLDILDIGGDTHGISAPSWLVCAAFEEATRLGYRDLRYPTHAFTFNYGGRGGAGSDHESFLQKGIPAVALTTDVNRPIHTPQDNIQNFDARGMKRSGDIVTRLVNRFDAGVPDRELTNYWLYLLGFVKIFVPYWFIAFLLILTFASAVTAFFVVRKRRLYPRDVRWSGWKLFLSSVIMVFLAWESSNIVGFIKGYRYAWMSDIASYQWLAVMFFLLGAWISLGIAKKLPLSQCPYVYYNRTGIGLTVLTLFFLLSSVELAIYPASALFLLSLATIFKNKFIKLSLAALSPVWMILLIFNEWSGLIFRTLAMVASSSFPESLLYNGIVILFGSLYLYPIILGFAAVYRDAKSPQWPMRLFRSRQGGTALALIIVAFFFHLYFLDPYSDQWHRTVYVENVVDEDSGKGNFLRYANLRSAEYLDGIRITTSRGDTLISGRITQARIPFSDSLSEALGDAHLKTRVWKSERKTRGDTTEVDLLYAVTFSSRPYTVSVTYSSARGELSSFSSAGLFLTDGHRKTAKWYSFPDSIRVPVRFAIIGDDSVRERFEAVFDRYLPWKFEREKTNFIFRTKVYRTTIYRRETLSRP